MRRLPRPLNILLASIFLGALGAVVLSAVGGVVAGKGSCSVYFSVGSTASLVGAAISIGVLIWKFAMQFIVTNKIDVMFGCASFPGTEIDNHREVLTYLYNNNLAPTKLMPTPVTQHVAIKDIPVGNVEFNDATRDIPTLLRGYLKLGAKCSDTAIIDPIFNTTFICIYVDAKSMMSENTTLVTAKQRKE